jgi:hypothetical protein
MKKLSAYIILALAFAFALSPAFVAPFSGFESDQLPIPQIDPPIQPAGYAFSVWGLIYSWLVISAIYGLFKRSTSQDWKRARWPLATSFAIGVPWLAIANESAIWATVTIIMMTAGAIASMIMAPTRDRWLFQAPTAIYAGWLTAASCVSIGTTMAGYGILTNAFGWAIFGIILALFVSLTVFSRRRSAPEYLMTVVWALVGIIVANGTILPLISGLALGGILILFSMIAYSRSAAIAASRISLKKNLQAGDITL